MSRNVSVYSVMRIRKQSHPALLVGVTRTRKDVGALTRCAGQTHRTGAISLLRILALFVGFFRILAAGATHGSSGEPSARL